MDKKRNIYSVSYSGEKGGWKQMFILGHTDGEAMERFREFHQTDDKHTIQVQLIAKDVAYVLA